VDQRGEKKKEEKEKKETKKHLSREVRKLPVTYKRYFLFGCSAPKYYTLDGTRLLLGLAFISAIYISRAYVE
jgi:hypothetical protein